MLFGISFLESESPLQPQRHIRCLILRGSEKITQKVTGIQVMHQVFTEQVYNLLCSNEKHHYDHLFFICSQQVILRQYYKQWIKNIAISSCTCSSQKKHSDIKYKGSWKKTHISQQDFYIYSREFEKQHFLKKKLLTFFIVFMLTYILLDT